MPKAIECPNCETALVLGKDGRGVCPECGATIRFEGPKAKVANAGEFDAVKGEVTSLKGTVERIAKHLGLDKPDDEPKPKDAPADDADDDRDV